MSVRLMPADAIGAMKLRAALDGSCAEDPTLAVTTGPADEIVLQGMSELHLEIAVDKLKRGKGLDFAAGAPEVHYRGSITKVIEWDYTHKKQTGSGGEYAKVKIRFEPGAPGNGFMFESAVVGGAVPERFIPSVEKGLTAATDHGVIAGFPVIDIKCTLIDGGYHHADSTERAFEIAARACFREALPKAGPRLLEPIMEVGVVTPQKYLGDVVGDLNSRHGQVAGMDKIEGRQVIIAFVPVANLFGYWPTLITMTQGHATCTMTYSHYEQVPPYRPDNGDDTFPPAIGMRA